MDIISKELGSAGSVSVKIEEGKIKLQSNYADGGLDGQVSLAVDSDYFLDKLAEKIPGQIDDAIIQVMKAALKQL